MCFSSSESFGSENEAEIFGSESELSSGNTRELNFTFLFNDPVLSLHLCLLFGHGPVKLGYKPFSFVDKVHRMCIVNGRHKPAQVNVI